MRAPTLSRKELLALSPTHGAAALAKVDGVPKPKARTPKTIKKNGYDTTLEADYAEHLTLCTIAGVVGAWLYHPERIAIGPRMTYRPDFWVLRDSGPEFVETKGHWNVGHSARSAAVVMRLKLASAARPGIPFHVVRRVKKQWITVRTFVTEAKP